MRFWLQSISWTATLLFRYLGEVLLFYFQSHCKPQLSFQTTMHVSKWNQKDKQDSHRYLINIYKGSLPQCTQPLHPKLVNCLELHLGKKHHHPLKESAFRVLLSRGQLEMSDEEKQLFQAQHARGPPLGVGTFKAWSSPAPKWCQQQLGAVCISEFQRGEKFSFCRRRHSAPSLMLLHSAERTRPWWRCAWVPVNQLSALWKGLPFPLPVRADQEHQAADGNCDWFHKQRLPPGAAPTSELCVSKLSSGGVFFATATELHLYTV